MSSDYLENPATTTPTNDNPLKYNAESNFILVTPKWENYVFDGWYLDEGLTQSIAMLIGSDILEGVTGEHPITLYGAWYPAGTKKYIITYERNNDDEEINSLVKQEILSSKVDAYSPPTFTTTDNSPTYDKYFVGWCIDETRNTPFDKETHLNGNITLYGKWAYKHRVILKASEGDTNSSTQSIENDITIYLLPSVVETGIILSNYTQFNDLVSGLSADNNNVTISKYFAGWATSSTSTTAITTLSTSDFKEETVEDTTRKYCEIHAIWANKFTVTVKAVKPSASTGQTANVPNFTVTLKNGSYSHTENITAEGEKSYHIVPNSYIKISNTTNVNSVEPSGANGSDYKVTENLTVTVTGTTSSCIAAGTLITLADGTQKKVEDIVETDILLVFDHETGKYVESAITFIERDGWSYYNVINLDFSNGTKTRLIYEHGLFNLTLNKYVYIDELKYESFIGHEFAMMGESGNAYETVTLDKAYITYEYTGCYSLVTMYHLNYFIDGLFSMPGGISGLFNYFEYGEDLKYDEEQMQADIEKYGLFTYEDFEDLIPYEIYEYAFPAKYYKISIAKGLMTWEDIINMIEIYLIKNGVM